MPQIVLVEDNKADVGLVREALEQHAVECELIVISNGEAAVRFIGEIDAGIHPCPHLVIVDLNLPKKPGKEVLRRLRSSPECEHVPLVVLTSSNNDTDKQDAAAFNPSRYVRKPSRLDDFIRLGALFKDILHESEGRS